MSGKKVFAIAGLPASGKSTTIRMVFKEFEGRCIYRRNCPKEVRRAILDMGHSKMGVHGPGDVSDELEDDLSLLMGIHSPGDVAEQLEDDLRILMGVHSPGDVAERLEDDLTHLIGKGCRLIVCAARSCKKWESSRIKTVNRLAKENGYEVRWFKTKKIKSSGNLEAVEAEKHRLCRALADEIIQAIRQELASAKQTTTELVEA
jgi:hypothetical protein